MTRNRLKIGPGGAMYAIVALLILLAATYTQADLLFWGFGLMVGGLLVSVLQCDLMLRGLEVQRMLPHHGVAGEPLVLRYQVRNRKRWVPVFGLVIHETWGRGPRAYRRTGPVCPTPTSGQTRLLDRPFGWVLHLAAGQRVQAEARCWPLRRGLLRFERVVLSTSFPFGVVRRTVELEQEGQVLIYPHLWRLDRRILHGLARARSAGRQRLDRSGGHEEFFGLRLYRAGDSPRTIDWKRSARTGELVCRELTQLSPPRVMIALDLSAGAERRGDGGGATTGGDDATVEAAISLTASVVCDAHFNGCQVGLVVLGAPCRAFPVHHSLPHRARILEALARLDATGCGDAPPVLPVEPTLLVRLDPDRPADGRTPTLYATRLEQYVSSRQESGSALLLRRGAPRHQSRQLPEGSTWG